MLFSWPFHRLLGSALFWLLSVGRGGPRGAAPVPPVLVSAAPGRVGLVAGRPRLVAAPGSPPGFQSPLRGKDLIDRLIDWLEVLNTNYQGCVAVLILNGSEPSFWSSDFCLLQKNMWNLRDCILSSWKLNDDFLIFFSKIKVKFKHQVPVWIQQPCS